MNKAGLFGGGWEDYLDALNEAFDRHAAENAPPHPFGASVDAIMTGYPDKEGNAPGLPPGLNFAAHPYAYQDFQRSSFAPELFQDVVQATNVPPSPAGDVPFKSDTNPPSPEVGEMVQCIQRSCPGLIKMVTSTSEKHSPNDPHTRGLAADVTTADPQTLMQCAAECGAVYQQDEYSHPSAHATGPHVHLQRVPGKSGATGPYYPLPRPTPRPDR